MEDLWRAAQKELHNQSFISVKDEEIFAQDGTFKVAALFDQGKVSLSNNVHRLNKTLVW